MYGTVRWKRMRGLKLNEEPFCMSGIVCDPYKTGRRAPSTVVDHVLSVETRPDLQWDYDNLRGLCQPCHSWKTNKVDGGGFNGGGNPSQ
jgi:5-methylcytosine-specific restriction protein A